MPTPRKVPCLPCKESHLKCDGHRPVCERCRTKKLDCRLPSRPTRFIKSTEGAVFARDQRWVNSRAKKFCFDRAVPLEAPAGLDLPLDSPPSDAEPSPASAAPAPVPAAHHLEMLADAATTTEAWGGPAPRSASERILALPAVVGYGGSLDAGYAPLAVENPHPAITAVRSGSSAGDALAQTTWRQFPLQDFGEACLLKYYLDQVAGWLDIADPDRHFELVIPLIARSKAYILSAILALSARHLLSSAVPTPRPDRLWYLDELAAQVDSARVEGYVRECAPALQRLDAGFLDPDELEGIVVVAALLRQVELLERQATSSWSDAQSGSTGNLLPVVNNLLDSADFKTRFPHSGLVQAVYLMVLRQEVYHCLSSGERPAVSTVRCSPDISFIHETTIHMLEVLQLEGGAGVERDALLAQQDQLENSTLAGIQPIFQREPDRAAGDLLPLLWFNSRTEMYCIQLAKMARAILTFGGDGPPDSATQTVKHLVLELHGIAADRTESEHGTFHATALGMMYRDLFGHEAERRALRGAAERMLRVSRWPYERLMGYCAGV